MKTPKAKSSPSKLTKRLPIPKQPAEPGPERTDPALDECPTVVLPDPEAESTQEKVYHKTALPAGKISHPCQKCHIVSTVYVDDPDSYSEEARISLFKARGSSYKPPLCRWCVSRQPARQRKA